jgi:hypothetical protein
MHPGGSLSTIGVSSPPPCRHPRPATFRGFRVSRLAQCEETPLHDDPRLGVVATSSFPHRQGREVRDRRLLPGPDLREYCGRRPGVCTRGKRLPGTCLGVARVSVPGGLPHAVVPGLRRWRFLDLHPRTRSESRSRAGWRGALVSTRCQVSSSARKEYGHGDWRRTDAAPPLRPRVGVR